MAKQTVAAGAHQRHSGYSGHVRVFRWNSTRFSQMGEAIRGGEGDNFGFSVSLSSVGNTFAAGGPQEDRKTDNGYVRVYTWTGNVWSQVGQVIILEGGNQIGGSVSLSGDAQVLAVGAYKSNNNTGAVALYELQ